MENIIIKRATLDNLIDIQNLNNKLFELEKSFDDILIENWPLTNEGKKYFSDLIVNNYVVIAIIDKNIVGYLAGSINEKGCYEEVQYGEINNMYIDSNYRLYGIGRKLFESFRQYCLDNNITNLQVTASAKNKDAINFYKKIGFKDFNITLTSKI